MLPFDIAYIPYGMNIMVFNDYDVFMILLYIRPNIGGYAFKFYISFVICLVEYDIYNSFKSSTSEF